MMDYMAYVWTLSLILCVLMEAATAGLVTIWFMPAGFICLLLAVFEVPIPIQIVTYIGVSAITLVIANVFFRDKLRRVKRTPTNADRVVGMTAVVTVKIDNDLPSGEVTVAGQTWTARSESGELIDVGERVTVERIEGVKLIVRRPWNADKKKGA